MKQHVIAGLFLTVVLFLAPQVHADRLEELRGEIESKGEDIAVLDEEIAEYQQELNVIGQEKRTLEGEIRTLDLSRTKLLTNINATQGRIDETSYNIEALGLEIGETESSITQQTRALAQTMRKIDAQDTQTLVEALFADVSLAAFWEVSDTLEQFQLKLQKDVGELSLLRDEYKSQQATLTGEEHELTQYKVELGGQKEVVEEAKTAKDSLLSSTKNEESAYQALLAERVRQKEQFERELKAFEAEIQRVLDPTSIPAVGSGVLRWPIAASVLDSCGFSKNCLTQYFGNTPFATQNPQVYNGKGHNGIDIAIPIGTTVRAALGGLVEGTGNTDTIPGCLSYGKWILVRHNNGLSTLYMHLSSNSSVSKGQQVDTGDVIGLSGNSGYTVASPGGNGAHLHFTVFATDAVEIQTFDRSIGCKAAVIPLPVSGFESYLNPLSYL